MNKECSYCESPQASFMCAECGVAVYCDADCQSKDWVELHQAEHIDKKWIQQTHMHRGPGQGTGIDAGRVSAASAGKSRKV